MRKLFAGLAMSLDGVVHEPSAWMSFDDEMGEIMAAGLARSDAVLLGTRTYSDFAELWPRYGTSSPMAAFLNQTPKYVVTHTLDSLDWGPAHRIGGALATGVAALKAEAGQDIIVPGSPRLVASLMRERLLDELALMIAPVVVGSGLRLFDEKLTGLALTLVDSRALRSGVLSVTYRPTDR
jgi:dihydrofolate reductase